MRYVERKNDWPENWKLSYKYDLEEVFGRESDLGYSYAYASRRDAALSLIREVLPLGATILDVAAAQGNFSLTLAELGYRVTWNDLRADLIDYVRLKHERGSIDFLPGNVFEMNVSTRFDAVLATEIVEHVAHPDQFFKKIAELIKPNGYIIMTTPNGGYFMNDLPKFSDFPDPSVFEAIQFKPNSDGHIFLLHRDEIASLAGAAGLKLDRLMFCTNFMTNGHVKTGLLLKILGKSFVFKLEELSRKLPPAVCDKITTSLAFRLTRA
jgi:2-polyprenyl-6-hydroxyphenyl methylase/3-demethylubiquinone-9 3-methyltransferase